MINNRNCEGTEQLQIIFVPEERGEDYENQSVQNSAYIKPVRVRDNGTAFTLKAHYRKETAGKVAILRMGCPADFYGIAGIQADTEKRGSKAFNSAAKSNGADHSAAAGGTQSRYGCNL